MADAACAIIGNIKEFRVNSDDLWSSYIKRVKAFFLVNNIKKELQTSYLITLVGNETYELMTVLCSPNEPEKKSFDELVKLVEDHVNPKASDMAERMKLRACLQTSNETVNEYLLRLKKLAMTCKFKGQESLEENLRDQFTYGLRSEKYRQRLLADRELTFKRAVTLATTLEAAEIEAKLGGGETRAEAEASDGGAYAVGGGGSGSGVTRGRRGRGSRGHGAAAAGPQRDAERCYRCGSRQHTPDICAYRSARCFKCDNVGHISLMCNNNNSGLFQLESDSDSDTEVYTLRETDESDSPWYFRLSVEGVMLDMQVDSGSSVSAISKNTFDKYFQGRPLHKTDRSITLYSGNKIKPIGIMPVHVGHNERSFTSQLYVMDNGNCPPILGRKWMCELKININWSFIQDLIQKRKYDFEPGINTNNRGNISLPVCSGTGGEWSGARSRPAGDAELARREREVAGACGCAASPGAVWRGHSMPEGRVHAVACAIHSLTPAERY